MGFTIEEEWESRSTTKKGRNSTHQRTYFVYWDGSGVNSEQDVIEAVEDNAPSSVSVGGTSLNDLETSCKIIKPDYIWKVDLSYNSPQSSSSDRNNRRSNTAPPEQFINAGSLDEIERLGSSGDTVHLTHAFDQSKVTGANSSEYDPFVGYAVEYDGKEVKGYDAPYPVSNYEVTKAYTLPRTTPQRQALANFQYRWRRKYGFINSAPWRTFEAYCARFDGLELWTRDDGVLMGTFRWAVREPALVWLPISTDFSTGLTDWQQVTVPGWFRYWTRYREAMPTGGSSDETRLLPEATYIYRANDVTVFTDADLSQDW